MGVARQGSGCGHGQEVCVVSVHVDNVKCDRVRGNQAFALEMIWAFKASIFVY